MVHVNGSDLCATLKDFALWFHFNFAHFDLISTSDKNIDGGKFRKTNNSSQAIWPMRAWTVLQLSRNLSTTSHIILTSRKMKSFKYTNGYLRSNTMIVWKFLWEQGGKLMTKTAEYLLKETILSSLIMNKSTGVSLFCPEGLKKICVRCKHWQILTVSRIGS